MIAAYIIDTETTGVDDPEPIEIALSPFWLDDPAMTAHAVYVRRFKPSKPITLGALATHHILDEDLSGEAPWSEFEIVLPPDVTHIIGYKVDFDWQAIGKPDVKRIDVMAMCRTLWPTLDSHTQGAMLYFLDRSNARERLRTVAHSAEGDLAICRDVLWHVLTKERAFRIDTLDDLWRYSEECRIPKVLSFGKHKGTAIADLPSDYKQWMLRQADMDPYVIKAVRASLYAGAGAR